MWTVYQATNRRNGKRYIGVTARGLAYRKRRHLFLARKGGSQCPRLYDAIRKYGTKSFSWKIVATFSFKEFAYFHEHTLVKLLKPEYNVAAGGLGGSEVAWNKKAVICLEDGLIFESAMHAARKYNIDNSDVSKACRGIDTHAGGRHFRYYDEPISITARLDLIRADKEKAVMRRRRVTKPKTAGRRLRVYKSCKETICLDDGKIFPSASSAASYYSASPHAISELCRAKRNRRTVGERHFAYVQDVGQRMFA
jgi:hypothetical protein